MCRLERMDDQMTVPLLRKLFCDPPQEVLPILRRFVVLARNVCPVELKKAHGLLWLFEELIHRV